MIRNGIVKAVLVFLFKLFAKLDHGTFISPQRKQETIVINAYLRYTVYGFR